ncbi:MAG: metallophosphoesterase [Alistipes sp.]|nr:metallophosphoesterase [Alistipes sp.]
MKSKFYVALLSLALGALLTPNAAHAKQGNSKRGKKTECEVIFSYNIPSVKIYSAAVKDTTRLFVISDTHLWLSDEREEPYRANSKRMAAAYNKTSHFQTGKPTNPEESLRATVDLAKKNGADVITLLGDMVSYPSERGVELVQEIMNAAGIPWYYTCGNHDWHYEGMEGDRFTLRDTWRKERLLPLFSGKNPNGYVVDVNGVQLLILDTSTYDVLPEQLALTKRVIASGKPFILMMHIPLYAPGRRVSYGIGNPNWGADNDGGYKIERREQWPAEGHTQTDYEFYEAVTSAPNLLASFSGHVHNNGVDIIKGKPHFTVEANAKGGYYEVLIMPIPAKTK